MKKEIRLNAFAMNCVAHQSPGLWTHPRDRTAEYNRLPYWLDLAKTLERGRFDGLFLAVHSDTLRAKHVEFDERFDFHFYDMDFCREAEAKGLRLGTWTVSVIHESGGNFASESWRAAYGRYLAKWRS